MLSWKEWWRRNDRSFDRGVRKSIAVTGAGSGALSPQAEHLVGELLKNLRDPYFDVRAASAIALGKLGRNTLPIREKLAHALRDKNSSVREAASLALGMIRAVESTTALTKILQNRREKRGFRCMAAVALGLMRNPANLRVLQEVYNASHTKPEVKAGCLLGMGLLRLVRENYRHSSGVIVSGRE